MKNLLLILLIVLVTGCEQNQKPRQYTQVETPTTPRAEAPADPQIELKSMGKNITPEAHKKLEEMIAAGQDPHVGLNFSGMANGKDPHTGMDMSGMVKGKDPHAGMDMSAMAGMVGDVAPQQSKFDWNIPKGWQVGPNKGPMRVASFQLSSDPQALDCSIVSLGGMAGGLEANLKRWMGQIGLQAADDKIQQLINSAPTIKTKSGWEAKLYDFTTLQQAEAASKSMIAAILSIDNATVFVKVTGNAQVLNQNREGFLELVKSLHSK